MPATCCIKGCNHAVSHSPKHVYCKLKRYPKDQNIAKKWEVNIKKYYFKYKRRADHRVCSCHFTKDQFKVVNNREKLIAAAIPTLFGLTVEFPDREMVPFPKKGNINERTPVLVPHIGDYALRTRGARRLKMQQGQSMPAQLSAPTTATAKPIASTTENTLQLPFNQNPRPLGFLIPVQSVGGNLVIQGNQTTMLQGSIQSQALGGNLMLQGSQGSIQNQTLGGNFVLQNNRPPLLSGVPNQTMRGTLISLGKTPLLQGPSTNKFVNIISGPRPDEPLLQQTQVLKHPRIGKVEFLPVAENEEQLEEFDGDDKGFIIPPVRELCRVCALPSKNDGDDMTSIFSEWGKSQQLANMILQHLPIMVSEDDRLPLRVCQECVKALEACHDLVLRCSHANITLRGMLLREEETAEDSPVECPEDLCDPLLSDNEFELDDSQEPHNIFVWSNPVPPVPVEFICHADNCSVAFYKKKNLINHYSESHNMHACKECEYAFQTEEELKEHIDNIHTIWLLCDECGAKVKDKKGLRLHMKCHMPKRKPHKCPTCDARFSRPNEVVRHMKRHGAEKTLSCPICQKKFFDELDVRLHMNIHAEKDTFKCDLCTATYSCKRYLATHRKRSHYDEWIYRCLVCKVQYDNLESIYNHIKENHVDENGNPAGSKVLYERLSIHCCEICGGYFANGYCLKHHIWNKVCLKKNKRRLARKEGDMPSERVPRTDKRTHANKELIKCPSCNDVLRGAPAFKRHQHKHQDGNVPLERHVECNFCTKKFTSKWALTQHIRQHTGEKPYPCLYCSVRFTTASTRRAHEMEHRGETPYQCKLCPKQFSNCSKRRIHFLTHIRPFECKYCAKKFPSKAKLIIHEYIHTGQRPFKCSVCQKGFKQKSELGKHLLVHTNDKIYKCSECNFESDKVKVVENHIEVQHLSQAVTILKATVFL